MFLLIIFIPVVFYILHNESTLPFPAYSWLAISWRFLLVPHNILMFICSLHLLQHPYPAPLDEPKAAPIPRRFFAQGRLVLLVAFILLLCNAAGYLTVLAGVKENGPTATMWMMMCLAVGGILGFLFAVPRANTKAPNNELLLPNRNIETISDWLTKIIVGLGLVNLKSLGVFLRERADMLAPLFKVDYNYVIAFILYFFVSGILEGYIITRIFLQMLFTDSVNTSKIP